jgi:hypothetical protein
MPTAPVVGEWSANQSDSSNNRRSLFEQPCPESDRLIFLPVLPKQYIFQCFQCLAAP